MKIVQSLLSDICNGCNYYLMDVKEQTFPSARSIAEKKIIVGFHRSKNCKFLKGKRGEKSAKS